MTRLDPNLHKIAESNRDLILDLFAQCPPNQYPNLGIPIRQAEDYLRNMLGYNEIQIRKDMDSFKNFIYSKGNNTWLSSLRVPLLSDEEIHDQISH